MRVGGIVLCGGKSSRMGRPKAWLPVGEETMLGRVTRILGEVVSPIVVVAAPDQEVPPLPDSVRIVRDEVEGRGPLQGLATGLSALASEIDAVYLSSCDVPFLRPQFVRRLIELLGEHSICVPHVAEHYHPLAAVYRGGLLPHVQDLLAQDRLRPFFLFERVPTRIVKTEDLAEADPTLQSLRNLNTSEDYQAALEEL